MTGAQRAAVLISVIFAVSAVTWANVYKSSRTLTPDACEARR